MGKDIQKKVGNVSLPLTAPELAKLNVLLSKTRQPMRRLVCHFFEVMARSACRENLSLPPVLPIAKGEIEKRYTFKLPKDTRAVMETISTSRSIPLSDLVREWCIRTVELCERHHVEVMPTKEDIERWLENRSVEPEKSAKWYDGFFHSRKAQ